MQVKSPKLLIGGLSITHLGIAALGFCWLKSRMQIWTDDTMAVGWMSFIALNVIGVAGMAWGMRRFYTRSLKLVHWIQFAVIYLALPVYFAINFYSDLNNGDDIFSKLPVTGGVLLALGVILSALSPFIVENV